MTSNDYPRLLGDVGGTNARWAWQATAGEAPSRVKIYPCAEFATIDDVMRRYLADERLPQPAACAIGIATPVTGDHVRMTNHSWSFSIEAVRQALGLGRFVVVNDFTALALALPTLSRDQLRQVGGGAAVKRGAVALLGAGTGLGVSGLVATQSGRWVALAGEGGHATLSARTDREAAVIRQLQARFGHASAERALSGPGLVNVYEALCTLDGQAALTLTPADVSERGLSGADAACREALSVFCSLLGSTAGNLALTLGATGGVYIGGGIVPRLGDFFRDSEFRVSFEAKGRFTDFLKNVPVFVIEAAVSPALEGAAQALDSA